MWNKDKNRFYVYLHRRGDNNEVFYVGKGCNYRATSVKGRNQWWTSIYNKCGRVVEYVEKGLTQEDAFALEMETIKFYRDCGHQLCNLTEGGDGGTDAPKKGLKKSKIYTYHDHNTGRIFESTQNDMLVQYGLSSSAASLVTAGLRCCKGVSLYGIPKAESLKFTFVDVETKEEFNLTRVEAMSKFNLSSDRVGALVYKDTVVTNGITLKGKEYSRKKPRKFEFVDINTGIKFWADYKEMNERYGMAGSSFTNLINGKLLTSKGCCLAENFEEVKLASCKYTLVNPSTGEEISGTRKEVAAAIGSTYGNFGNLVSGRSKSCCGFVLK